MKKIIMMLVLAVTVAAMAGNDKNSVVAPAKQYDLTLGDNKDFPILYNSHEKDSEGNLIFKPGNDVIKYTVTASEVHDSIPTPEGGSTPHRTAQLYFTNSSDHTVQFSIWKEEDWHDTANIEGQNQWHEIPFKYENAEHGENGIKDYGIYLYDPENPDAAHVFQSAITDGKATVFEVKAGESFGVYYGTNQVHKDDYVTTTDNWVGDYDNEEQHETSLASITDDAELIIAQEGSTGTIVTSEPFMCLFKGSGEANWDIEYKHFEFIFAEASATPSGQPLPGTLATILISSICAGALRKRNKKA